MGLWGGMRCAALLLCVAGAASVAGDTCAAEKGLRRWLCMATFNIPDVSTTVFSSTFGNIDLQITGLRCTQVLVRTVSSNVQLQDASKPSFSLNIEETSFRCSSTRFHFRQQKFPNLEGEGDGTVEVSGAHLHSGVQLMVGSNGLASSAILLPESAMTIGSLKVELHGQGPWLAMAEVLEGLIGNYLKGLLPREAIQVLEGLVKTNLTQAIGTLDSWVKPYLQPTTPLPEPPQPEGAMDWRTSPMLELLDFVLDTLVGTDGPLGVDGFVRMLTNETGVVNVPRSWLPHELRLSIPLLGKNTNLTVDVVSANVSGLDSFKQLRLLEPLPNGTAHSLDSSAALDRAKLSLQMRLTVVPGGQLVHAPPLTEEFRLVVDAQGLRVGVLLLLSLNATGLAELTLSDLNTSCALRPQHGQKRRLGGATPHHTSLLGRCPWAVSVGVWPALYSREEPLSHSARSQRLRRHRQAVPILHFRPPGGRCLTLGCAGSTCTRASSTSAWRRTAASWRRTSTRRSTTPCASSPRPSRL